MLVERAVKVDIDVTRFANGGRRVFRVVGRLDNVNVTGGFLDRAVLLLLLLVLAGFFESLRIVLAAVVVAAVRRLASLLVGLRGAVPVVPRCIPLAIEDHSLEDQERPLEADVPQRGHRQREHQIGEEIAHLRHQRRLGQERSDL